VTRHPYGPDELDRVDVELDEVAHRLERHAEGRAGDPSPGLQARIHAAIDAEPDPARGWWGRLIGGPGAWAPVARAFATAGLALAIVGAVAIGVTLRDARPDIGSSPTPSVVVSPAPESSAASPSPTPSATPTPTATPSPTDSPRPTVAPTVRPATAAPTASDDDDDETETPEPSGSDHSGSGGGGGDD
jgi:hypothetical protein